MSNVVTQGVSNYLVPATGSPNAYVIKDTFTASPQSVNFQNIQLNGLAFRPSGVIIDNTKSASALNVLIPEMSFNISCPAGASLNMPYPAPMNHSASITGAGDAEATVIFVDYPLQPYSSAQAAGSPPIPNPLPVSGPLTDAEIRAQPLIIDGPVNGLFVTAAQSNPLPVGVMRSGKETAHVSIANGPGITLPFAVGIFFKNVGTTNVTIDGATISQGIEFEIPSGHLNVINQISYDATGGSLLIVQVDS